MPAADPTTEDQPESPGSDDPEPSQPGSQDRAAPISVDLINHTDTPEPAPDGWLASHVCRAAELAGVKAARLTLVIVNDDEMAQLHEQYTGVAGTTDVLTFDLLEDADEDAQAIEGDIVLCLDEAGRQAQQRGHETHHELLLYAVHGLLHLLGEDDHDEADYQRMHAREDELLKQLGVGPLFDTHPKPPDADA